MKITCDYCGFTYEDTLENCPSCGAPNPTHKGVTVDSPKTIEELRQWYRDRNLPPEEVTRFFIGTNYTEPRAFGIYFDENTGNYVVYKNKATGVRAIRYEGKDEAYAVNELCMKLKEEILHQKSLQPQSAQSYKRFWISWCAVFFITLFFIGTVFFSLLYLGKHNGYYDFNGTIWYKDYSTWYRYDDDNTVSYYDDGDYWSKSPTAPSEYAEDTVDIYYMGSEYENAFSDSYTSFTDVTSSNTWQDVHESDYDWDSGSSWDSGGTDWSSDW